MDRNQLKESNTYYVHNKKEYQKHLDFIHNELIKFPTINIPNQHKVIKNQDLEDWIVEKLSPKDIAEIIFLLENAKKRASSLESIFQVIATSLLQNS
ncbi:hypothetical protein [Niallia sp. MER TA 168]|uniref:hypothetical protein n=1 Tax=Niallia sp. MER TA 168 TaxID=2939568 RepID=UPI00203C1677|nr:hypothetical protein [Niallia sp. MER TA 168]MCM3363965.1 hypothetical protein [Niallia sp. MER TA 168]